MIFNIHIFIDLFLFFRYVNAVDKALKSFEYTSEWADLISALGKLNKVKVLNYLTYIIMIFILAVIDMYHNLSMI